MDSGTIRAILLSALLHAAVAALLLWGLPRLGAPLDEPPALPVEVVILEQPEPEVAEEPAATPAPEPEPPAEAPAPEPEPVELAEPEPEPELAEQPTAEPEEAETPEREPEPDVAEEPEPEIAEEPEPDILEEPAPELAEGALPEPDTAETPQPEPQPTEPAEPAPPSVATAVPSIIPPRKPEPVSPKAQVAAQPPPEELTEIEPPEPTLTRPPDSAPLTPQGLLADLAALRDEDARAKANPELWEIVTAVRAQIARCWQLGPAEARNPRLSVDIAVAFDRDGRLLKTQVQEIGRMVVDEEFKVFATSAHRALKACSPFDLPADKYDIWRDFTLRFVPRQPS